MDSAGVAGRRGESKIGLDRDWPAVAASAVCLMLSVGTLLLYSFGVFVRPLAAQFHWNRTQISGALLTGELMIALSSLLWGSLLDRFSARAVILPSIAAMSLAFASLALLTPHLWHLYLVFALFSLFGGGASPIGYASVLVRSFERHLGLALGLALMGIGLGAATLPALAQASLAAFGWRATYAIMGFATLVVTVPAALFVTRNVSRPIAVPGAVPVAILPMVFTRAFLLMCAIFILLGVTSGGTLAHLVPMMVDRGFRPASAARVASLAGIMVIAGRGGIGWLLDRVNALRLLAGVALTIVAALLLLRFASSDASSYLAALLIGSVLGAEVDFTAFLIRRYFGNAAFGRLYGLAFGIFVLGTGVGPLLLGLSFDKLGSYQAGLLLFIALGLIAAAATFAMPAYTRESSRLQHASTPV